MSVVSVLTGIAQEGKKALDTTARATSAVSGAADTLGVMAAEKAMERMQKRTRNVMIVAGAVAGLAILYAATKKGK